MNDEVVVDTDVFSRVVLAARPSSGYEGFVPLLQGVRIVLSAQTVGELLIWARSSSWGPQRVQRLDELIARCAVVPIDRALTEVWADLSVACRQQGHGLQDKQHVADRWIAATAIHLGIPLVSNDGIFIDAPLVDLLRPE
jgi:predicted nucleic acid-binding protein